MGVSGSGAQSAREKARKGTGKVSRTPACATKRAIFDERSMQRLQQLLQNDPWRMDALCCLREHGPEEAWLAAGFLRNAVWDSLHGHRQATPLNDLDVVYFDPEEADADAFVGYERRLARACPGVTWQVRNQAWMHRRNGDAPYRDLEDALAHWPERETAVAVRLGADDQLQCLAVFGWDSLFDLQLTPGPHRPLALLEQRAASKGWLQRWPRLRLRD